MIHTVLFLFEGSFFNSWIYLHPSKDNVGLSLAVASHDIAQLCVIDHHLVIYRHIDIRAHLRP